MANPLSDFAQDHHIILGIALVGIGVFGFIGSATGRLPAMLAGLFDPSDLITGGTGSGNTSASSKLPSNQPIDSNVSDIAGTGITGDILNVFGNLIP